MFSRPPLVSAACVLDRSQIRLFAWQAALADVLVADMMAKEHSSIKVFPMSLRGHISTYPHMFLAHLDVNKKAMHYLDACTSNDGINAERTEQLTELRAALARFDSGWAQVQWSEWQGWEGGVPQQVNDADCLLLAWYFATQLVAGAESVPLLPQLALRGLAARLLLLHIIRSLAEGK